VLIALQARRFFPVIAAADATGLPRVAAGPPSRAAGRAALAEGRAGSVLLGLTGARPTLRLCSAATYTPACSAPNWPSPRSYWAATSRPIGHGASWDGWTVSAGDGRACGEPRYLRGSTGQL
jgi:hypothetical protein